MVSLRRSKNYASDAQTPLFLYAILKQLDLRSIDWNVVADKLEISNGHAARMRYSRMKTQFEGMPAQPRAPRPKKEKSNSKPTAKETTKGKRQLLEEEEERLTRENIVDDELQYPPEKRIRRNPALESEAPLHHLRPSHYERFADPTWASPMIKFEHTASVPSINVASIGGHSSQTTVKQEPDDLPSDRSDSSSLIKKEPVGHLGHHSINAMTTGEIKIEPGPPNLVQNADNFFADTRMTGLPFPSHAESGMRLPLFHHPGNPAVQTLDPSCLITRSRPMTMDMSQFRHHRPIVDYFPVPQPTPNLDRNFMFSPHATSFEDMLTMSLHQLPQADFGTVNPGAGTENGVVDTNMQNTPYTDDFVGYADAHPSTPPSEINHFEQFIEHSPKLGLAVETGMNEGSTDLGNMNGYTTEVSPGDASADSKDDSQGCDDGFENVRIKREIIEIHD